MAPTIFPNSILLIHASILILPILAFTAVLLALVYYYQWQRHHPPISGLDLSSDFVDDVFYVDLSSTRLILVASWSSSTVLALIGSFMTISSFLVATDLLWTSTRKIRSFLPSPTDLALMIDLLDGKRMAVWQWVQGLWSRSRVGTRSIWLLELLVAVQIFALILRYVCFHSIILSLR